MGLEKIRNSARNKRKYMLVALIYSGFCRDRMLASDYREGRVAVQIDETDATITTSKVDG